VVAHSHLSHGDRAVDRVVEVVDIDAIALHRSTIDRLAAAFA
jgi:hypothetical protein